MYQVVLRVPTIDTIIKAMLALLHGNTHHQWKYCYTSNTDSYDPAIDKWINSGPEIKDECSCGKFQKRGV